MRLGNKHLPYRMCSMGKTDYIWTWDIHVRSCVIPVISGEPQRGWTATPTEPECLILGTVTTPRLQISILLPDNWILILTSESKLFRNCSVIPPIHFTFVWNGRACVPRARFDNFCSLIFNSAVFDSVRPAEYSCLQTVITLNHTQYCPLT